MIIEPKGKSNTQTVDTVPELKDCIAKTIDGDDGVRRLGIDVYTHCLIVGLVARELVKRLPESLPDHVFPTGVELVAASHDVGKINPYFQEKLRRSLNAYANNSFPGLENAQPHIETGLGGHAGVSQAALSDKGKYIDKIAGAHHGKPQDPQKIKLANDEVLGGEKWQVRREELIGQLKEKLHTNWPQIDSHLISLVVTGLTTVSDWIGSSSPFEYQETPSIQTIQKTIQTTLAQAGFDRPELARGRAFQDIFPYKPYPMQEQFIECVDGPGVYILEEQMGQGKTEAALAAAYKMLERGISSGIYFALPTRLTSEKIYERFAKFLRTSLEHGEKYSPVLAHGLAWLYDTDWGEDARPGHSWFAPKKRAILAPFAVGTIDQALMAVMNVKHGFVRTFGLVGKVVILDEVHTYDAYTGTILDELISSLYRLGCVVIVLSATLQNKRKKEIFEKCGCTIQDSLPTHYPQVAALSQKSGYFVSRGVSRKQKKVTVRPRVTSDNALEEAKQRASRGEYVLWIENTVKDAQAIYKQLGAWGAENNVSVGLLHSRFTAKDRQDNEETWVEKFGNDRPSDSVRTGCILVGTQVLEQSLDIDADFLVTKIAPSDMLLQRIGRLWRKPSNDNRRPKGAKREVYIISPPQEDILQNPAHIFEASGKVYSPYVLFRTCEIWNEINEITLPMDIRGIIDKTYEDRPEQEAIYPLLNELQTKKEKLRHFANLGMASAGHTGDDNAQTRYSEQCTVDVLLLKAIMRKEQETILTFPDGETLSINELSKKTAGDRRKIAKAIQPYMLTVPEYQSPNRLQRSELKWLQPYMYLGNEDTSLVALAFVQESGIITGANGEDAHDKYTLRYSKELGYGYVEGK